jgi:hypothetical protein
MYGGSQMAAMFRELAGAAAVIARQEKSRGSFFDDFKLFVLVRNIWQTIIQSHMPRPDDELLAQVCQEWDALWTCPVLVERHWVIRRPFFRTGPGS